MKPEEQPFYIPDEDEPSVFGSCVNVSTMANGHLASGSFDQEHWYWPTWLKAKKRRQHLERWRSANPDAPALHYPPFFDADSYESIGLNLIVRLRTELKEPDYPVFAPTPTMFIGDTRKISLRWVLQYARDNQMDPNEAVLVAEHERDLGGLTLNSQPAWKGQWWKEIMELPGIGYPIWRYKDGHENVAIPYLLMPGPLSESIVIVRVHEKNPNISYKLVTIRQKGGEVVGEFTGYEGFDRVELDGLLKSFRAGFWS
jgi:hypothetical protein